MASQKNQCHQVDISEVETNNSRPAKKTKINAEALLSASTTAFSTWLLENDIKQSAVNILLHEEIEDIGTLIRCTESQLEQIGIKLGPRIKILNLIKEKKGEG